MNLDELRSVQSKERKKDSLQNLRPSFYQEVGEYIAELEDERDRVADATDDPFSSPEVGRLTDEIETAKDVVEAIYERRMGKLVKQASLAAAGMVADDEGLTAEEADLFDDLVDRISANKSRVLDVLEGVEESPTESGADATAAADEPTRDSHPTEPAPDHPPADDSPPTPPEEPPADIDPTASEDPAGGASSGVSPADVMGGDGPPIGGADGADGDAMADSAATDPEQSVGREDPIDGADSNADAADSTAAESNAQSSADSEGAAVDRTTVRITRDIGEILGVDDREYTLTSDDIVTLPEQNAAPLVDREAAERLE
ncbi:DNA replication complex subunit Gins51 [Natrinema limicola]|uniref:GINS subunit domain-containing protein n=1 Tax=Natrinema limicola JCM 13563 TaxID=1230457 RepID=M0CB29_9EURY|nr:hypothetical protein [Natrinema limicola]ELZ20450.1 hypothetical protein C476_11206 [Natrinema limicola JCM 13563]